jgi:hypothetical protein
LRSIQINFNNKENKIENECSTIFLSTSNDLCNFEADNNLMQSSQIKDLNELWKFMVEKDLRILKTNITCFLESGKSKRNSI